MTMRPFAGGPRLFWKDDRAAVAVIFAFSLLGLFLLIAASVDYARIMTVQSRTQAALDNSLLQALRDRSGADKAALAQQFMAASLRSDDVLTNISVTYSASTRTLSGSATLDVPMTLASSWKPSTAITLKSEAKSASDAVRILDLAVCVNASYSASILVNAMKSASNGFAAGLDAELAKLGVPSFDQVRVRPIYYRDFGGFATNMAAFNATGSYYVSNDPYSTIYIVDPLTMGAASGDANALEMQADFFEASRDPASLYNYASGIIASGGGDQPDSGLECFNEAMNSPWATKGGFTSDGKKIDIVYPMIVMMPYAPAHPLNFVYSVQNPNYPATMPRDSATFAANWASKVSAQPNLSILFLSPMYSHPVAYMGAFPFFVPNGFLELSHLSGFHMMSPALTGSALLTTLATAVANTYALTTLTQ